MAFILIAFYIGIKYLLALIAPFLIAWLFSSIIRPMSLKIHNYTRIPLKLTSTVLIILFLALIGCSVFLIGNKIYVQAVNFLSELTNDLNSPDNSLRRTLDFFIDLKDKIPIIGAINENSANDDNMTAVIDSVYSALTNVARDSVQKISGSMATTAGSFLKSLPGAVFFVVVSIISMFYLTFDYAKITEFFMRVIPAKWTNSITSIKTNIVTAIVGYCKAYSLIMFITFAELLAGFLILNVKYSLIFAILIAILDILPVIGAGGFIIPWGIVMFITGNHRMGWGLLIMYVVMYIVRQIAEPKIVGDCIGVHPLASLFSVYIGFRLFGVGGLIAGPIIALIVKLILLR